MGSRGCCLFPNVRVSWTTPTARVAFVRCKSPTPLAAFVRGTPTNMPTTIERCLARLGLALASLAGCDDLDAEWAAVKRASMSKGSWPSLRPAGAPEATFGARSCLRLPQAPTSLGQSAARLHLGHTSIFSTQARLLQDGPQDPPRQGRRRRRLPQGKGL